MEALLHLDSCTVYLRDRLVVRGGGRERLTDKETALLLYLSQRRAAVPRAELLARVWGYGPTVRSRTLDTTVHNLRAKIEADARSPAHIITVRGVGYQFTSSRRVLPDGPGAALASLDTGDSFVGRRAELATLRRALDGDPRVLTLLGPSGIGKSRLVHQLAGQPQPRFPGGVCVCDLAGCGERSQLLTRLAEALSLPLDEGDPSPQISAALAALTPTLLVLDNFEQLVRFGPETVGCWADLAPGVTFLITSRIRLRLKVETSLALPPLRLPDPGDDAATVASSEAVSLFVDRAQAVKPDFSLSDESAPLIAQIVRQLDGLPLAIELAAARSGLLSPSMILERLGRRFDLLRASWRDRSERQNSIRATLDWSWELMSPAERAALAQCSIFRGGFPLEGAEAVLEGGEDGALDMLQSLHDQSLVRVIEAPNEEPRFDLYLSIREYAAERLAADPERSEETTRRHAAWCAALGGPDTCRRERDNLDVALARTVASGDTALAVQIAVVIASLSLLRGPCFRAGEAAALALGMPRLLPDQRAQLLYLQGVSDFSCGRASLALSRYRQALSLAQGARDIPGTGRCLLRLGLICPISELPHHLDLGQALVLELEEEQDPLELGVAWTALGTMLQRVGRLSRAREALERALRLHREVSARPLEGETLLHLGGLALETDRRDEARAHSERALSIGEQIGDGQLQASALHQLGAASAARGELRRARDLWLRSLGRAQTVGSSHGVARAQAALAERP